MGSTDGEDGVKHSRAPLPSAPGATWRGSRRRLALAALGTGSAAFVLVAAGSASLLVSGRAARTAVWLATAVVLTVVLCLGAVAARRAREGRRADSPPPPDVTARTAHPAPVPAPAPDPDAGRDPVAGGRTDAGPALLPPEQQCVPPARPASPPSRRPSTGWSAR